MRRFGRVFCRLVLLALAGIPGAPPAAGQQVERIWFDPPQDRTTWHRGDVVKARIVPSVPITASGSHPVLELVIGGNGTSCWRRACRPARPAGRRGRGVGRRKRAASRASGAC